MGGVGGAEADKACFTKRAWQPARGGLDTRSVHAFRARAACMRKHTLGTWATHTLATRTRTTLAHHTPQAHTDTDTHIDAGTHNTRQGCAVARGVEGTPKSDQRRRGPVSELAAAISSGMRNRSTSTPMPQKPRVSA